MRVLAVHEALDVLAEHDASLVEHRFFGDPASAERSARDAPQTAVAYTDRAAEARAQLRLGLTLRERKDVEGARTAAQRSESLFRSPGL